MTEKTRHRPSPARRMGACVALLAFFCGCSGARGPVYEAVPTLDSDRLFVQEWSQSYPDMFKLVQRIVVEVGRKQYDFIGYLMMQRPATFRALGLGEMGGRIFDLEAANGKSRIVYKPEAMPPKPLLEGVIGDILFLFGGAPRGNWETGRGENDERFVVWNVGDKRFFECRMDTGENRPAELWEREGRRVIRTATFRNWRLVPGWGKAVPGDIVIENRRWGYRMEIELLQCEPVSTVPPPGSSGGGLP